MMIKPQPGPQERFLASSADIAIYGGAAGGGKTYAILMEPLRYKDVKGYRAVIFRNNYMQISVSGGLWDESLSMYSGIRGAEYVKQPKYKWTFSNKASVYFDYLWRDDDVLKWQGSQITMIGFDELTHFTEKQFFYMLSRNRSVCGVKPCVRATCNPDADSWVADFIAWWIDPDTGYPVPERSGVKRYMCRVNDQLIWADTKQELINGGADEEDVKSVTFISSTLQDNQILLNHNPGYLANLKALPLVERERLLNGNWKIKPVAGLYYKRTQIGEILDHPPDDLTVVCRGWDLAATDSKENVNVAYTAGVLMGKRRNGRFVILDVINQQLKAGDVRRLIGTTARTDQVRYQQVRQRLPQDPGQAGKEQAQSYVSMLAGYDVKAVPESGDKVTRAEPMAAQWQQGMFDVVAGEWNEMYFNQLESFPESKFKDMVDASSSAFNELTLGMNFNIENLL